MNDLGVILDETLKFVNQMEYVKTESRRTNFIKRFSDEFTVSHTYISIQYCHIFRLFDLCFESTGNMNKIKACLCWIYSHIMNPTDTPSLASSGLRNDSFCADDSVNKYIHAHQTHENF